MPLYALHTPRRRARMCSQTMTCRREIMLQYEGNCKQSVGIKDIAANYLHRVANRLSNGLSDHNISAHTVNGDFITSRSSSAHSQILGHTVSFDGKYPSQLNFLNPDSFLYNGDELDRLGWDQNDNSWHRTELYNRERYLFLELAFDYLLSYGNFGGMADYYEFGCHGANTFRMALSLGRRFSAGLEFHAFDSFQGLPPMEADPGHGIAGWAGGEMTFERSAFEKAVSAYESQAKMIHIHEGFYSATLTESLQQQFLSSGRHPGIVNIDCDLVQSYIEVLHFMGPLLVPGSILYFDEYFVSETRDLATGPRSVIHRFEEESDYELVPFRPVGWWGMSFICASKPHSKV